MADRKVVRLYALDGVRGLVERRRRWNGVTVSVYNARQAGLDEDGGCWYTMCDEHDACCGHQTLRDARVMAAEPETWCEDCGDEICNRLQEGAEA